MFKPFRKAFRLVGLLFPSLYLFTSKGVTLAFTAIVLLLFSLLEGMRFKRPAVNDFLFRNASMILREEERSRITTTTWFVLASLLVALLFKKNVAITAWLLAIFGDMAAEVVGLKYGRPRIWGKSLEGSLACLGTCLVVGLIPWSLLQLPFSVVSAGALAATVAELLPLPPDDNFTMPLFAGAMMTLAQSFGQC